MIALAASRSAFVLRRPALVGTSLLVLAAAAVAILASTRSLQSWMALAASTLISEDAACIAAGHFVAEGRFSLVSAVLACAVGIVGGDVGLYAIGRIFRERIERSAWLRERLRRITWDGIEDARDRLPVLVVAARFTPGLRLPVYLMAGATRLPVARFLLLVLVSAAIWAPGLVALAAWMGDDLVRLIHRYSPGGGASVVISTALLYALLQVMTRFASGNRVPVDPMQRVTRWEFWPTWVFYLPVAGYLVYRLARYRHLSRLTEVTRVNPCMPLGGLVGESKSDILRSLPPEYVLPFAIVAPAQVDSRVGDIDHFMARHQLAWPIILKPDVGQRGEGVQVVQDFPAARAYLTAHAEPIIAQAYHPGPYEAGIFYYRMPDEPTGQIFSITDKVFPIVTGDGVSTIRALIERHPRFRRQQSIFFQSLGERLDAVLPDGEALKLTDTGNHCRGTQFRDGRHLLTPALAQVVDAIARQIPGFHFGRFDIRYSERAAFMAGTDLAIIELNGLTSEATHIYDPARSIWSAWATLLRQWQIAYAIGHRVCVPSPPPTRSASSPTAGIMLCHQEIGERVPTRIGPSRRGLPGGRAGSSNARPARGLSPAASRWRFGGSERTMSKAKLDESPGGG